MILLQYVNRNEAIFLQAQITLLVYVIRLYAVQFGNDWVKKILRTGQPILDEAGRDQFGSLQNLLNQTISKLD